MMKADEFDLLVDDVLGEAANPLPPAGFAARMSAAMESGKFHTGENAMASSVAVTDGSFGQAETTTPVWEGLSNTGTSPRLITLFGLRPIREERRTFDPFGWALALHAAALLLYAASLAVRPPRTSLHEVGVVPLLEAPAPIKLPAQERTAGGGGGQKAPTPAAQGRLPKIAETQIVPPAARPPVQPKIAVEPAVIMQHDLKMAGNDLLDLGLPNSPIVGTGSLGGGTGTGIGSGNGSGIGVGLGGNTAGGAMRVGGGVSAPVPVFMPDPEFSEEARKAKVSGNVLVYLWVDQEGRPTHVRVVRGIGMGLDERAIAAVKQYRFKPARKDGRPVTVEMNVEVNFQIF